MSAKPKSKAKSWGDYKARYHITKGKNIKAGVKEPITLKAPDPPKNLVDLESIKAQFLQAWADPLDTRTELEFATDFDIPVEQVRNWRIDPNFYEPATEMFQRSFRSNLIPIVRNLLDQAIRYRSISASKTLLEMLGYIKGQTNVVVGSVNVNTGGGNPAASMNDEELEKDIQRLSMELFPSDVKWSIKPYSSKGQVIPVKVADFEEVTDAE